MSILEVDNPPFNMRKAAFSGEIFVVGYEVWSLDLQDYLYRITCSTCFLHTNATRTLTVYLKHLVQRIASANAGAKRVSG